MRIPFQWSSVTAVLASVLLACIADAEQVTWNFDVSTTGQNVNWSAPTTADPTAPEYDAVYTITRVEAQVQYLFFPVTTIDVTGQIPPDQLTNSGTAAGPPPITISDQDFRFPEPPQPIAAAAHVTSGMDASGRGVLSITNVQFGTYSVNLPPFGVVTVNIRGIRVVGNVVVRPIHHGDLDRDSDVDLQDLAAMLSAFGRCSGDVGFNAAADFDGDGCTGLQDLAVLLANFGRT